MKLKLQLLLICSLFVIQACSSTNIKKEYVTTNSIAKHQKRGAPVSVSSSVQKVKVNEESKIDITLLTGVKNGLLKVKINTLDKDLQLNLDSNNITFNLDSKINKYPISLSAISNKEGRYYINLFIKIINSKNQIQSRVVSIPVQIGKSTNNLKTKKTYKLNNKFKALKAIETVY